MLNFKEWLKKIDEQWFSRGKADRSRFKPGTTDVKPKPRDVRLCGQGGGPGPCQS